MTPRISWGGSAVSLATACAAAAVLAGCSSGSTTAAGAGAPTTRAAAPSTTTVSAASPSAPAGASSTPPASVSPHASTASGGAVGGAACSSAGLRVSLGSASGAAGSVYQYIEFQNISADSCTLYGFPGVSLLGGTPPAQIGAAATRAPNDNPSLVTLAPGAMASAAMRMSSAMDYPDATCDPVASATLRVYPPNQTVAQSVPFASTGCGSAAVKLLQINAVQPGTGNPPGANL